MGLYTIYKKLKLLIFFLYALALTQATRERW